jgi:hypothetical protein
MYDRSFRRAPRVAARSSMNTFKPHALLAKLLPPASKDEIDNAVERVRLYGQREPVEVLGGVIIAGHLEYVACLKARATPRITTVALPDDLVEYVVRRNVPRHLSTLDRACIAVLAQDEFKKLGVERMREGGRIGGTRKGKGLAPMPTPFDGELWFQRAARLVGTTAGAVRRLAHLHKNAPDVFDAVRSRRISTLREARDLAWHLKDPKDRAGLLDRYEATRKATPIIKLLQEFGRDARRAQMPKGTPTGRRYVIYAGPMARETNRVSDSSVDLVHADVVYNDVAMAADVARISARVLVEGGILALVSGNERIQETVNALCERLTLITIGSMIMPWSRRSLAGSRVRRVDALPVFICVKGPSPARTIEHLAYVAGPLEDRVHEWQKPLSATLALVRALVDPGAVVLDPCCGSGTTGVAALAHGCTFIGIDVDAGATRIAASRLASAEGGTSVGSTDEEPSRVVLKPITGPIDAYTRARRSA